MRLAVSRFARGVVLKKKTAPLFFFAAALGEPLPRLPAIPGGAGPAKAEAPTAKSSLAQHLVKKSIRGRRIEIGLGCPRPCAAGSAAPADLQEAEQGAKSALFEKITQEYRTHYLRSVVLYYCSH